MQCDTDSLYIAIAKDTIDECVKKELSEEWKKKKVNIFSSDDENTKVNFEGNQISLKEYDKRTSGKYKIEFIGVGMICLNSKVFHIWRDKEVTKTSCKGVQKRRNPLTKETFLNVLENPLYNHLVTNCGFIINRMETETYVQTKRGLSYFYCKRKVHDDGIHTSPLDI